MAETDSESDQSRGKWLAAAGVSAALVASSCCVVPLVLVTLGIGGAWMGNLTALESYEPYFISVTVAFLGTGFWTVYFKPKKQCDEGSYCARPASALMTRTTLWVATLLVVLSATVNLWAPLFYYLGTTFLLGDYQLY